MTILKFVVLVLLIIIVISAIIALCLNEYFYGYRSVKTLQLRKELLYTIHDITSRMIKEKRYSDILNLYRIYNKVSYEDMRNSFKPFKLESWWTDEEIKITKGENNGGD